MHVLLAGGRQPVLPPDASLAQRLRHASASFVMWGSGKLQQVMFFFRGPIYALGVFVFLLIAIHVASPDPVFTTFPSKCPTAKCYGCSRVALQSPHTARGLKPLRVRAPLNVTQAAVEAWIEDQSGTRILVSKPGFIHARVVTPVWGFADDFMVGLTCSKGDGGASETVVEAQGQLRIGKSDLGVNARRNQRFFDSLQAAAAEMPSGACGA